MVHVINKFAFLQVLELLAGTFPNLPFAGPLPIACCFLRLILIKEEEERFLTTDTVINLFVLHLLHLVLIFDFNLAI